MLNLIGYILILVVFGGGGFLGLSLLVSGWLDLPLNKAYKFVGIVFVIGVVAILIFFVGYNVVYNLMYAVVPIACVPKTKLYGKDGLSKFARKLLCKDNSSRSKDTDVFNLFKTTGRKAVDVMLKSKQHN